MIVVYYTDGTEREYATHQEAEAGIQETVCGSDFAATVECVEEDEKNLMVNWEVSLDDDAPGNAKEKATHSCPFREATDEFFAPYQRRLEDLEDDNNINGADLVDHLCEFYEQWKTLMAADAEQAPVGTGIAEARRTCPECGPLKDLPNGHHKEECLLLKSARREYEDDELEIDQDADVSEAEDEGCWVSAWVFVSTVEIEAEEEPK